MGAVRFALKYAIHMAMEDSKKGKGKQCQIPPGEFEKKFFDSIAKSPGTRISTLSKEAAVDEDFAKAVRFAETLCQAKLSPDMKIIFAQKKGWANGRRVGSSEHSFLFFKLPTHYYTVAHESVHACDDALGLVKEEGTLLGVGKTIRKFMVDAAYLEGRAAYAVSMFDNAGKNWVKRLLLAKRVGYPYMFAVYCATCLLLPIAPVLIACGIMQALIISDYISINRYLPFYSSIRRIENAVGDPELAFRITSSKVPSTMKELRNPLEFYKEEIAAAKARKTDEPDAA